MDPGRYSTSVGIQGQDTAIVNRLVQLFNSGDLDVQHTPENYRLALKGWPSSDNEQEVHGAVEHAFDLLFAEWGKYSTRLGHSRMDVESCRARWSATRVKFFNCVAARDRISSHVNKTPVITCSSLNAISGFKLFFKCENFQKGGSFKARGAHNAVFSLSDADASKGVVTHSSGNHAQACALAARARGIPAHIVMPSTAPEVKKNAVRGYGAEVIECEPESRAAVAAEVAQRTGGLLVHPSNDPLVIAGQGTVALELLDQVDGGLDAIVVPLGGGGLISGVCAAAKSLNPGLRIFGAEPMGADDAFRSKIAGSIQSHRDGHPSTIADGLCTNLGSNTFPFVRDYVEEVITVSEKDIAKGMVLIYERAKLVIEPSAGTGIAVAVFSTRFRDIVPKGSRVGIILCGGNIDLHKMSEYMALASG